MTIVRSESRATGVDFADLRQAQAPQSSASPRQSASASSATPSPFELLFAQQLNQSTHSTPVFATSSLTVPLKGSTQDFNSTIPAVPKSKPESANNTTELFPLVNPLTANLFTTASLNMIDILTTYLDGTDGDTGAKNAEANGESAATESPISSTVREVEGSTGSGSRSIEEEFATEEPSEENAPTRASEFDSALPASPPPVTNPQSAVQMDRAIASRIELPSTPAPKVVLDNGTAVLNSANRFASSELAMDDASPIATGVAAINATVHTVEPVVDGTQINPLLFPMTSFVNVSVVEMGQLLKKQLAATIRQQLEEESVTGTTSIRIQLDEEELGQIQLQLTVTNNVVSLKIVAKNPRTKKLLEQQLEDLRQSLGDTGIDCGEFQMSDDAADEQSPESSSKAAAPAPKMASAASRWAQAQTAVTPAAWNSDRFNFVV